MQARRSARRESAGFTLLAILVVLAALTLVVGMALQRGEDERRSAILVRHEALALSAAEYGLDRSRAYLGAILDKEGDLDKALDPLLNTNCVSLVNLESDAGTEDDNLPVIAGGERLAYGGADRPFLLLPYNADNDDAGTAEGAYLIRFDDNDDDGPGPELKNTTGNNVNGLLDCREGLAVATSKARTNTARDRDRSIFVTVVGIAPGKDVTRAQARKVLRARLGSAPGAGLITGGTIDFQGASHVCGAYGNVSVFDGGFENGCVCGAKCGKGPADNSCGTGNACFVQTTSPTCNTDFGGAGGNCTSGAPVPPAPNVHVWSRLNAPPKCTTASCIPFYYLKESASNVQVYMWNYAATDGDGGTDGGTDCSDPQGFARIHYPGEPGVSPATQSPAEKCWTHVYKGGPDGGCPSDEVRIWDDGILNLNARDTTTVATAVAATCKTAPLVWKWKSTPNLSSSASCDTNPSTPYPEVGGDRYKRNYVTAGTFTYQPSTDLPTVAPVRARIPHGVWLVDGNLTFGSSTPGFDAGVTQPPQRPVTLISTGDVVVMGGSVVSLTPAHREVALMAGRDLDINGGNTQLLTCGDPSALPPKCPSAALMVYEQFKMGANTHVQGQVVVQSASTCSDSVKGKAVQSTGNATISVPALPPFISPGGAMVLSWGEGSF
jgi:hypothetical protein